MNPESHAWLRLREHAAAQLPANFPDRVLRAARAAREVAPSMLSHIALSAATAAACLLIVAFFHARTASDQDARSLAGWDEIAAAADDAGQTS